MAKSIIPLSRGKRKAYREGQRIQLHDEAPRIGSGWRTVSVRVGRKWVHLVEVASGRSARLSLRAWQEIAG